ncbi:MAG: hypothetical protein ACR2O4_08045 [Hyphomicrobiaceae bacterium]
MDKSSDAVNIRHDPEPSDDMEQVRQLLIGDHAARQAAQIAALEHRIEQLEQLLSAIVAHSDSSHRAWQDEVSRLLENSSRDNAREASHAVTPISARPGDDV